MDFIILNKYDFYHASSLCVKEELKKKITTVCEDLSLKTKKIFKNFINYR